MNLDSTVTLHTGRKMPVIGMGTWQLTGGEAIESLLDGLKMGYRMIDTSSEYHNQRQIGNVITNGIVAREDIYLISKVEETDDAYERTEQNLEELDTDYLDLLLIHRPPEDSNGEALWSDMIKAKHEGLVRDIGVSNYSAEEMKRLGDSSGELPAVNQIEWTPFGHSEKMREFCAEEGIVIQAYSPLTRGHRLHDDLLRSISDKHSVTPAQVLIRWNLQQGTVPLPKARSADCMEENLGAFDFELHEEDLVALNDRNETYSALAPTPMYI